jgi:hypothetical protein
MFIQLTFGEKTYRVVNYSVSVGTVSGDTKLANCVPGELSLTVELPPSANPAAEFLGFAVDQHNIAKDKGQGTLTVFKEEGVDESLKEIAFKQGWITDLDMATSEMDDKFNVSLRIAAADMVISGVQFNHRGRGEHFS